MPKPEVVGVARARQRRRARAELSDAIEGHIVEICRDLASHLKRMRQLQEQADELRGAIREWATRSEPSSARGST